jgi:hypothetical protein
MMFDSEQLEILFRARVLGPDAGQVLTDDAYPAAWRLAKQGWLRPRPVPDGEMAWFLTEEAKQALDLGVLVQDAADRCN